MKRSSRIKPKGQLLYKKIQVPVERKMYARLKDIGLLPKNMDLAGKKEMDIEIFEILFKQKNLNYVSESMDTSLSKKAYKKDEATIDLTIKEIDPVYSYLFDNSLRSDDQFN